MRQAKTLLAISILLTLLGCLNKPDTGYGREASTAVIATPTIQPELKETVAGIDLTGKILTDDEVLAVLERWVVPGVDISKLYEETYCGLSCIAFRWAGLPDRHADFLLIALVQHESAEKAEIYLNAFDRTMLLDNYLTVQPISPDFADSIKDGVDFDFIEYYSIARVNEYTAEIIMRFDEPILDDFERRGAIVVVELYARLQLEKLLQNNEIYGFNVRDSHYIH